MRPAALIARRELCHVRLIPLPITTLLPAH
jgi:hypothetical protein